MYCVPAEAWHKVIEHVFAVTLAESPVEQTDLEAVAVINRIFDDFVVMRNLLRPHHRWGR